MWSLANVFSFLNTLSPRSGCSCQTKKKKERGFEQTGAWHVVVARMCWPGPFIFNTLCCFSRLWARGLVSLPTSALWDLWHTPGPSSYFMEIINSSLAFCCCCGSSHLVAHHWHKLMLLLSLKDWLCLPLSLIYNSLYFVYWLWGMGMPQSSWDSQGCWYNEVDRNSNQTVFLSEHLQHLGVFT